VWRWFSTIYFNRFLKIKLYPEDSRKRLYKLVSPEKAVREMKSQKNNLENL